jgi:2-oxoglutarate dehydrogenase complex dehydrogenase (E1) component-like enzyme
MEKYLKQTYLGKVGYEYWHLTSKEERDFLKVLI